MPKLLGLVLVCGALSAGCDDDDDDGNGGPPGGFVAIDAAPAGGLVFAVMLTADVEVPVCPAARPTAQGVALIRLAVDDAAFTIEDLRWTSLSTAVIAAHIHWGPPGVAGPIVFPLDIDQPVNERFTATEYPDPVPAGAPPDFASFVAELRAGNTYVNVHTGACMPGEIRGQIR